jgi:hypothetical protein
MKKYILIIVLLSLIVALPSLQKAFEESHQIQEASEISIESDPRQPSDRTDLDTELVADWNHDESVPIVVAEVTSTLPFPLETISPQEMSAEQLVSEREFLEGQIKENNVLHRLNQDLMSAEERQAWGKVMERLTGLRRAIIEIQLEKINHQAEQMMKQLQEEAQHEG